VKSGQLSTRETARPLLEKLAFERLEIRSCAYRAKSKRYLAKCYESTLATGLMIKLGRGLSASSPAQSIGDPGTQAYHAVTFHVGGHSQQTFKQAHH